VPSTSESGSEAQRFSENPLPRMGGAKRQRSRSAGVGFRINNPHQVVDHGPKNPPCPRGDAVFIERGAAEAA